LRAPIDSIVENPSQTIFFFGLLIKMRVDKAVAARRYQQRNSKTAKRSKGASIKGSIDPDRSIACTYQQACGFFGGVNKHSAVNYFKNAGCKGSMLKIFLIC
jgi:hypothetical protein